MELFRHYQHLASYDGWANLEVITSFRAVGTPPPRSLNLMSHIYAAERIWLTRLLQQTKPLSVWPELTLEQCEEQAKELPRLWQDYLGPGSGGLLAQEITYKNSKGESWKNSVQDILTHVFMHSAYHRGQIAADMRQAGHVPAYTDFIHGVRQGLVE